MASPFSQRRIEAPVTPGRAADFDELRAEDSFGSDYVADVSQQFVAGAAGWDVYAGLSGVCRSRSRGWECMYYIPWVMEIIV